MQEQDNLVSISTERQLLGSIFKKPELLLEDDLIGSLFTRPQYEIIFSVMNILSKNKKIVNLITVQQYLEETNQLNDAKVSMMCLLDVYGSVASAANGKALIKILKELALKRALRKIAEDTLSTLKIGEKNFDEIADIVQDGLNVTRLIRDSSEGSADITQTMIEEYNLLLKEAKEGKAGLETGLIDFDKRIGGMYGGDLMILAARPGMGKTALVLNIARHLAFDNDKSVLFVSLEMKERELKDRIIASIAGVDNSKFRTPSRFTPNEWRRLKWACSKRVNGHCEVLDKAGCNPAKIENKAKEIKAKYGLDLIIVDYIGLMNATYAKPSDRVAVVSEITRSLKVLAGELDVPVLALSQLNRGVESRQDKRPMLQDLRESGSVEQDADSVLFLYRDGYYNHAHEDKRTELIIAKNRHGGIGTIMLYFDANTTTFKNLSREEHYE